MDRCPFGLKLVGLINLIWSVYYLFNIIFNFSYPRGTGEILMAIGAASLFTALAVWIAIAAAFSLQKWTLTVSRILAGFGLMITLGIYGIQSHELMVLADSHRRILLMWGCLFAAVYFILVLIYLARPVLKEQPR